MSDANARPSEAGVFRRAGPYRASAARASEPRRHRPAATTAAFLALALLSACRSTSPLHTGSIAAPVPAKPESAMTVSELDSAVRGWGTAYERDPKNKSVGLGYASALQTTGRTDQSLAVMQQMAIAFPKDRDVLSAYGKALAAAGQLPKALETVRRAQTPDHPDWRLYSAEGAILDQIGRTAEARDRYRKALDIQPGEPSVLSNLGLSYLLANDLKSAEETLRKAVGLPGADSRVRQNLALVVGLQGRFEEAETIAAGELSPEAAAANVAYLRKMVSQQNSWAELKRDERG